MISRFLPPILALAVPCAFGQVSLYGPATTPLKAGDIAPDIVYTKILSAPSSADWTQSNLKGQLTIVVFSLRTSQNPQIVTLWNKLVDNFAGKQVQFVLVSGDKEGTLEAWLGRHPIKGWVFADPGGKTGNAYGLEQPATVFIGTDGKIIGFGFGGFPPEDFVVDAALERRITTKRPTPATMKSFLDSHQVHLDAEPFKVPSADEYKPKLPPSYTLHVAPFRGESKGNFGGDDYRVLRNYTLKEAISDAYGVNPIRISLPKSLDNDRHYDFSLLLPQREDQDKIKIRMQHGLEDYFHIAATREHRIADVYILTAAPGRKPPFVKRQADDEMGARGGISSSSIGFQASKNPTDESGKVTPMPLGALTSVSFTGTAGEFCRALETLLDRPVVNETGWQGEIEVSADTTKERSTDGFVDLLRDQFGLAISSSQRHVKTLVFHLR